jgi:hypothetical protein
MWNDVISTKIMFSDDTTDKPATRMQADIQIHKGSRTSNKTTKNTQVNTILKNG